MSANDAPQGSTPGDRTALLLALRLSGASASGALSTRTGWPTEAVEAALGVAARAGLVRESPPGTWAILPAGRVEGERLLAVELLDAGQLDAVRTTYERFLAVNPDLLQVCTDWQLRTLGGALAINDHTDPDHDAAVVAALDALHRDVIPELEGLATVPGFASYVPRLGNALARVHVGDVDYMTKPTVDSYHQVWFELHEHLLAALGIERSTEGQAG